MDQEFYALQCTNHPWKTLPPSKRQLWNIQQIFEFFSNYKCCDCDADEESDSH